MESKTQSIKISSVLYEKISKLAKREDRFIRSIIDNAIKNYLKSRKVEV